MDTSEQAILDETPKREVRRRRSDEEKRRIVEETLETGASVARVARRHDKMIREYLASIGREGGKARALKYDKATLSKWAKKGGRPPKKGQSK